jgi:hypothetical protein
MSVEPEKKSTRKEGVRLLAVGVLAILIGAAGASFTIYTAKSSEKVAQEQAITLAEDKKQSNICQNNPEEPLCKFSEEILQNLNANGTRGPQGEQGPSGKDGRDGIDGSDGVNGKDGKNGIDGTVGPAGKDGLNGLNGTDGAAGADGAQGPMGPMGPPGPKGDPGINGTDATLPTQYNWTRNGVTETCIADSPGSSSYTCQPATTQKPTP